MPRGLTDAQIALLGSRVRAVYYAIEVLTATPIRIWTGAGTVTLLGNTWSGVGDFGVVQGLETTRDLATRQITVGLSGIPAQNVAPGVIASTRAVRYQGAGLNVYFGFADTETFAPLADPTVIWSGYADVMTFRIGSTISCSLTGEHLSSRLRRTNGLRMTTESQNARLGNPTPRDLFFEPGTLIMGQPRQLLQ